VKKLWIPLAIVLVLVAAWFIPIAVFDARISRAKAALRADGNPAELAELAPMFAAGDKSSAAVLDSAGACFDKQDRGRFALADSAGWQRDPADTRALVAGKAAALPLLMRAAAMGPANFGMPYMDGAAARITDLTRFSTFHYYLSLVARGLAASGRADSALKVLDTELYLAQALAEPVLIYHLVNMLSFDSVAAHVAQVAPRAGVPAVEATVERLERLNPEQGLFQGMQSEVVIAQASLASGADMFVGEYPGEPAFPWIKFASLRKYSQTCHLEFGRNQLKVCRMGWSEAQPELDRMDTLLASKRGFRRIAYRGVMNFRPFFYRTKRFAALRGAAALGLKVLVARKQTGRIPASLAEVASPVPLDPFSGKEFVYRVLPDGHVVYSVGRDGKDDGGDERSDIVFRISLR